MNSKTNKLGQSTMEYTVVLTVMIILALAITTIMKKTFATVVKGQMDVILDSVNDANECCKKTDGVCISQYRTRNCSGDNCHVPKCLEINLSCTVQEILAGESCS